MPQELLFLCTQTLGHLKLIRLNQWKVISNHVTGNDGAVFITNGRMYNLNPERSVSLTDAEDLHITLIDYKDLFIFNLIDKFNFPLYNVS